MSGKLVLAVCGALVAAGLGLAPHHRPAVSRRDIPDKHAAYHTIHLWKNSVSVPSGWKLIGRGQSMGTTSWTIGGMSGQLNITATPLTPHNAMQLLPIQPSGGGQITRGQSPYSQISTQYSGDQVTDQITGANGTQYVFTLNMFDTTVNSREARHIRSGWRHEPVITVTQAVKRLIQLRRLPNSYPPSLLSLIKARDEWLLVAGEPATAQESYFLFRSVDGGSSWTLERYTIWNGCANPESPQCLFIGAAGPVAMKFWSGRDGIIANGFFAGESLDFIRTTNGGMTWEAVPGIKLPGPAEKVSMSGTSDALTVTIWFYNRPTWVERSTDGGVHWMLVRTIASQSRRPILPDAAQTNAAVHTVPSTPVPGMDL